jgi:hypothetical protein
MGRPQNPPNPIPQDVYPPLQAAQSGRPPHVHGSSLILFILVFSLICGLLVGNATGRGQVVGGTTQQMMQQQHPLGNGVPSSAPRGGEGFNVMDASNFPALNPNAPQRYGMMGGMMPFGMPNAPGGHYMVGGESTSGASPVANQTNFNILNEEFPALPSSGGARTGGTDVQSPAQNSSAPRVPNSNAAVGSSRSSTATVPPTATSTGI